MLPAFSAVHSLIDLPAAFDDAPRRLFRVVELSTIAIYPASITCRVVPEYKTEIEKSYAERKRLMTSAGGDAQSLEAELDKIKELRDLLVELRESTEEIIKERIKEGVWESFKKILPDTQFAEISLDDNYSFSFIDKGGFESKVGKLSVGEAKTLALALISTLSNDIGYSDTPLFVDNLFAGIETSHFEDITRCVESLSDKKQIFITYLTI